MGLVGYNLGGKRYSEGKLGVWVLGWLLGKAMILNIGKR